MTIVIKGTEQELFDRMVEHLATQKKKSMFDNKCVYRTPDNLKCIIGCLIPDEEYQPSMEGKTVNTLHSEGIIESNNPSFLSYMQITHDMSDSLDYLRYRLYKIAQNYHLDDSKVRMITEFDTGKAQSVWE